MNSELPRPVTEGLFASRTVLVFGEVDMDLAERAAAQLLSLDALSQEPILVIVNSPGGTWRPGTRCTT